jgi:glycosyltransferase involved in cell wall biosynthesis
MKGADPREKVDNLIMSAKHPRILFIGIPEGIHGARWTQIVLNEGWDVHFFPAHHARRHGLFSPQVHFYDQWRSRLEFWCDWWRNELVYPAHIKGLWRLRLCLQSIGQLLRRAVLPSRGRRLARVIDRIRPDAIHVLMIQPAGYEILEAKRYLRKPCPPLMVQNWGNDIHFFGRLREHRDRIREVLSSCDYYDCECERDVDLAREFGFKGEVLNVCPVSGGYDVDSYQALRAKGRPSARRVIAVKGYEGLFGRAFFALRALEIMADELKGYTVEVYLPRNGVAEACELFEARTGIPTKVIPPAPHEEIMRLQGQSRISIGLNVSDGISHAVLEAMIMGAFPIQANTACLNGWIEDGKTGLVVPPEDLDAVVRAIRKALRDDALIDTAADTNLRVAREKVDLSVTSPRIIAAYKTMMNGSI